MSAPSRQEIRTNLEKRREDHLEQTRREDEAMDAFAVRVVQSLTVGLPVVDPDSDHWSLEPSAEPAPVETIAAMRTDARHAIEARRHYPASSSPVPEPGEPPLRAALRGIVADYAEPITPAEWVVTDLKEYSGIALDEADSYGLWANLELAEVLGVRAAMRDVVDIVTHRAESTIIAELVAAQERLASEYPDVPRTDVADATIKSRGQ
jgi:hypothetical protein